MKVRIKNKTSLMMLAGTVLVVVAAVLFIWFLLRGETEVSGDFPDVEIARSINCVAENVDYPFFEYNGAIKRMTIVNVIFDGDKVSSISLLQKIYYSDEEKARAGLAANHSAMNKAFGSELGADALNANYSVSNNVMQFSIYASDDDFNINTRKFFLIRTSLGDMEKYIDYYAEQGFECMEKTDEK